MSLGGQAVSPVAGVPRSREVGPDEGRRRRARPLWLRSYSYWSYQYKRIWRSSITTSFLYPLLYLAAMGVGLGSLIDKHVHHVGGFGYLDYVAPGLLAATAMQIGANEAMYPVMGAIKWYRSYFAMLATPIRVIDVLRGHLAWIATRVALVSAIYLVVIAAFGVIHSPLAVLALPAAVAAGMAFAAPIAAFAATQDKDVGFTTIYRFVLVPLFLFSGTFFPVAELPGWLQPVAYATPLYHGVSLCRGLVLGTAGLWPAVGDAAYLVAVAVVGYRLARTTFTKRLVL
jgi:lipooligosaccharide transport system permease protein